MPIIGYVGKTADEWLIARRVRHEPIRAADGHHVEEQRRTLWNRYVRCSFVDLHVEIVVRECVGNLTCDEDAVLLAVVDRLIVVKDQLRASVARREVLEKKFAVLQRENQPSLIIVRVHRGDDPVGRQGLDRHLTEAKFVVRLHLQLDDVASVAHGEADIGRDVGNDVLA